MRTVQTILLVALIATIASYTSFGVADDVASAAQTSLASAVSEVPSGRAVNFQDYADAQGSNALLPKDTIYLRNNSNLTVVLYAFNLSGDALWDETYLNPLQEVSISSDSLWLAVATKTTSPIKPIDKLRPETLQVEPIQWNAYWVALLRQGHRYEVCWNASAKKWRTGEIKISVC
jgi:hypothetical protein